MKGRALAVLVVLASVLAARPAWADRVLVVEEADMRFGARLRAELRSLGFDVTLTEATAEAPTRTSLEEAARAAGAAAVLRLRASRAGVEVWVMDRVTEKTVLREVVLPEGDDESAVALGAVELLRASLLEVGQPRFSPREVPASPLVRRLAAMPSPPPPRLRFGIGPALAVSPGGLAVTPHVDVWLRARVSDHFDGALRLVAPTFPASVEEREGRAALTLSMASVAGDVVLLPPSSVVRPRVGVGVGALWMHMEGAATQAFVGRSDDVLSAFSFVHAGATFALGPSVRLFADATVGVADPRPVVAFADRRVASWGQPAFFATAGVELAVF